MESGNSADRMNSIHTLLEAVRGMPDVVAIGKSGGAALGDGDVDLFVFCDAIPSAQARRAAVSAAGEAVSSFRISEHDGIWGYCDFLDVQGEVCLLYFTTSRMREEIESVLRGERLHRENDDFFPIGRCATIEGMHAFYDRDGYIEGLKRRISPYPEALAERLVTWHRYRMGNLAENFERALMRGDVLFFHEAMDAALDHFLQALFAVNRRYFPGRKRSLSFIEGFASKPVDCGARLVKLVELGARVETMAAAWELWRGLEAELGEMRR